jgi:hypothetical protein
MPSVLRGIEILHRDRRKSCGREDDWQTVASEAPVNGKVAAVGGDDFRTAMDFG